MRPTEAVIDLGAIGSNVERLVKFAAPARVCAVTKADAYGHGSVAVARAAVDAGAEMVAVALVEEGIELRQAGLRTPILVLSEPRPNEMTEVVEAGLTPAVYTADGIAALGAASKGRPGKPVPVHLKLDTGMNRVGLRSDDPDSPAASAAAALALIRSINDAPSVQLAGVFTHFAVADEPRRRETALQTERFGLLLDALRPNMADGAIVHASNSAGLLAHPDARFDMVRVGIAIYGIAPSEELAGFVQLEPAMRITSEIGLVKMVRAGEKVSYGLRHEFESDTMLATIPIGYADGLRRDSSALGAEVLVGGRRCPIVGTVTMDQTMVDLGPESMHRPGDEVVVLGRQGDQVITVAERARMLNTIPYEVVCDVGRRVRRRYV